MATTPAPIAQPRPGTVKDQWGDYCRAADADSYPLTAKCENCGERIRCADGTADWGHVHGGNSSFCDGAL